MTSCADCPGPKALTAEPSRLLTSEADTAVTGTLSRRTRKPNATAMAEHPEVDASTRANSATPIQRETKVPGSIGKLSLERKSAFIPFKRRFQPGVYLRPRGVAVWRP